MSNRFPCQCPRAKQIVGQKSWIGFAGNFAFPGFKANWLYAEYNSDGSYVSSSGEWTYSVSGAGFDGSFTYACTGSAPTFAVGDLVLREFPAAGPMTDYLTGLSQSYPKYYQVYICTTAITGSAADPALDTAHFAPWNYCDEPYPDTDSAGPSGWPTSFALPALGTGKTRAVFSQTAASAQLELTLTTTLANFPLFPATISGLTTTLGISQDECNTWQVPTVQEASASGAFAYDWTFANNYDGAAATYTPPGAAPSTEQAPFMFPLVPTPGVVAYVPTGHYSGSAYVYDSLLTIGGANPPALVTWAFSASTLTFQFAAWSWTPDVSFAELPGGGGYGALASAPATVTQTIALGSAPYTLFEMAAQALALMNATEFSDIAWGTSWTNTYGPTGTVVSTQNTTATAATAITEAGAVGTPVNWAVAVNGSPFAPGGTSCFMTQALVDVCGNYCTRTYAEGTTGPIACANGNVDGFAPFTLSPPATPGQSAAIYAGSQCA